MATILVVDDLAANREFLVTLLRYSGHRLIEAADGREGLAVAKAERPDLIISDVLMPVMDGYELVRLLRLDPETARIPVVFCTAHYGEREARDLALSGGVAWVLTKPAEPEQVLTTVNRALAGESEAGSAADVTPLSTQFDREHLRLLTDKLSESTEGLKSANARLRALINIGLELASERDGDRLLHNVCVAARDLFGATYVTLGIVDRNDRLLRRLVTSGVSSDSWVEPGDAITGVLSTVVSNRQTVRADLRVATPGRLQFPTNHPHVESFLAAPIASPALVYGWICLVGNEGRGFSAEDEQLVTALAGQVGRIYENGHFYSIAQRRAEELEREVQERKRVELALREERDVAQRYLDTAEVILLALDTQGRITLVNRYGCSLLGWSPDELIGREWIATCIPERLRKPLVAKFGNLVRGDLPIIENPVLTKAGEERIIEWRNTLLRDAAGSVVGTFSSGTDITERNRAVDALRTTEERMRFALENADVGIWDLDYRTGVLRWSEILERQYGLEPGTFAGTFEAFIARVHPEDQDALLETVGGAMKSGADFTVQHRSIWRDGSVHWLSGAGRILLDKDGEPVRGVGVSMDVTERHTLEHQYQQAQKMEALGRLAGGVAHDFNNLLTAILGYCELLLADLGPNDPRRADISSIHNAGTSAAALTRQLLAFSRKQIIEPTLIDLNTIVSELRPILGRLIGEDVKVVLGLGAELARIKADRGQLEQIVMNLAVNARDAMPVGGTLTVETANVELDRDYAKTHIDVNPGKYVALTVTDTGTGIAPDVRARLFEPFFTTKEPGKGTGLGLATVHGIAARSGGSVRVYSEVGRGSAFTVYLPYATGSDATDMTDEAPAVARQHVRGHTVLVVEDAAGLRELARRLLERQGYAVHVAANADEAREVFERHAIDVILTDVVMPGLSGPALTRQLLERRPDLKVLYMSGYTEEAIVQHGVLKPGIAFLHKPFTSETLGRKIREVIDR